MEKTHDEKIGRTLLISNKSSEDIKEDGIVSTHVTANGSKFVVFDSKENSQKAHASLKEKGIQIKYAYYKLFFRLNDVNLNDSNYDDLKVNIINSIQKKFNTNVVYFKFYTKNKTLLGSGDLTIDTKESLDEILNEQEIEIDNIGNIMFYRFKIKKNYSNEDKNELA